jgi:hypothetical protein
VPRVFERVGHDRSAILTAIRDSRVGKRNALLNANTFSDLPVRRLGQLQGHVTRAQSKRGRWVTRRRFAPRQHRAIHRVRDRRLASLWRPIRRPAPAPGFTEKPRRANRRRYEMALVQTSRDRLTLRDFSYVCPTCG